MASNDWVTRGFEAFRRGTCGNAGQNLYVSRAGVLQRIHLFDLDQDGYLDLVVCNAQDHLESPPAYLYTDVFGAATRVELPSDGASCGIVCDLNGDGRDDLVLGMEGNGATSELHALVYYGAAEGLSPKYHIRLPAPGCTDVAAGDFNGDGKPDLAFATRGKLRLFYQNELGYEPQRYVALDIPARSIAAADFDGDGYADLYVLPPDGAPRVYWGGADGLSAERYIEVPTAEALPAVAATIEITGEEEPLEIKALAKVLCIDGKWHLFQATAAQAHLIPLGAGRACGEPLVFAVRNAVSVAVGNVYGDSNTAIVFAAADSHDGRECSWLYPRDNDGYSDEKRLPLYSTNACDVVIGDLNDDGCDDIVLCQQRSADSFSFHSLVFKGGAGGIATEPVRLPSAGARRALIVRPDPTAPPQVVFVNRYERNALGNIDPAIFWGGPAGYSPDNAQYLAGHGSVLALGCDIDDDGRTDLVVANCAENSVDLDPGSYIFMGKDGGYSHEPDMVLPTRTAMAVACADLDRDGYLDLIFSSFAHNELLIFRGTAQGFDTAHPQRIVMEDEGRPCTEGRRMLLADLNGNGYLDLVLSFVNRDRCYILWGGPDGYSWERRRTLSVLRASVPQAADLTGNGYLDLIIGGHQPSKAGPHDSFLYIYWNGPDGLREDRRTQVPIATALNVSIADFNNDGYLDLFVPSYHNGRARDIESFIFWGGADGGYHHDRCTTVMTHSAAGCLAADFNEDGYIDLAIANHKTDGDHIGESYVLWNGPAGFDTTTITRLPTKGPHGIMHIGPGNQRDRGHEEFYNSEPHRLAPGTVMEGITWEADLPAKTWVRAQLRTAPTLAALDAAPWQGPTGDDTWYEDATARDFARWHTAAPPRENSTVPPPADEPGPWVQYRLALGAVNSGCTPRVRTVTVRAN